MLLRLLLPPHLLWRSPLIVVLVKAAALLMMTDYQVAALHGSDVRCRGREGESVEVPGITTSNPCYTCRCVRGIVECEDARRRCPSLAGCYVLADKQPGECCQRCQACQLNSTTVVESGEVWRDTANPCITYCCHSGVVTRQQEECEAAAACAAPSPPGPGECCPTCPSCLHEGVRLREGETARVGTDPCRECSCRAGRLQCRRRACSVLACPVHLQSTPPGECCPQCSRRRPSPPALSSSAAKDKKWCLFRNKMYSVGEEFTPDTCTACSCSAELTTLCSRAGCAPARAPAACEHEEISRPHGSQWSSSDCHSCHCDRGRVECTRTACPTCPPGTAPVAATPAAGECCPACRKLPPPPPSPPLVATAAAGLPSLGSKEGVCTVFGDPHYKTFDGRVFNFQGSCKYLLTRDCGPTGSSSTSNSNSSFSIRITNDARDTVAFSWLRTVTVRLADTKVSLLQKMRVKVDGKRVNLPYIKLGVLSVMQDGYRVILRTNEGARILWDGVSFLELTVPARMAGQMCGLCGNFNGDRRDDLIGRHGNLLESGQEFGNSWRVGGRRACSILPRDVPLQPPPCRQDWDSNIRSSKHCAAIQSSLFSECHRKVPPDYYFKACRIDMCECPGTQCHCEVLTAYARECERAGVRVPRWRESTGCRHVIPFKYSGEHFQSGEAGGFGGGRGGGQTAQANAAHNEVLSLDEGAEQLDDYDAEEEPELDVARIGRRKDAASTAVGTPRLGGAVGAALAAHRPADMVVAGSTAASGVAREGSRLEQPVGQSQPSRAEVKGIPAGPPPSADVRMSNRKRQRRMRRLKKQRRKKEKKRKQERGGSSLAQGRRVAATKTGYGDGLAAAATIGTFNGVLVQRIPDRGGSSGSGSGEEDGEPIRNKLRWGSRARGDDSPPPFELLLAADDDPRQQQQHNSGEDDEEDEEDEDEPVEEEEEEHHPHLVDDHYSSFTDPGGTGRSVPERGGDNAPAAAGSTHTRPKMDLSDRMPGGTATATPAQRGNAAGRTPIPLLDSGEMTVSHRRFRRRRSDSSSSDVVHRRNWKRRRSDNQAVVAAAAESVA